jgi:hypothetical protein
MMDAILAFFLVANSCNLAIKKIILLNIRLKNIIRQNNKN